MSNLGGDASIINSMGEILNLKLKGFQKSHNS